ncbi:PREDICTED: gamma-aminobutyric acid type B receptor subunit 2-like [Amphimedon queenslandica]|uniref:G-protein coupled receptors family 3 profile domain-containing protein n=2 Tax=Amphimedon queenslandica TaxID=400682 RepID=A0AAN0J3M5_AMPQE|nr:PREDICTED: gamma-aminobutyric acid type B receptor subunit 2-like [Amphimedon queenslandica]|eukprot:XP_019851341.1 PREDICTED: gamma-aminobutyric acid type B receptor subunit 2-like [Amphimedon queenslandica]
MMFLAAVLLSSLSLALSLDSRPKDIYFSYITTATGPFLSSGALPIIDYALDEINKNEDILTNYTLSYGEVMDSKCQWKRSVDVFMDQFLNKSKFTYLSLIGCGCNIATQPVADISHYWSIPQIEFASSSSSLCHQTVCKSFFQSVGSFQFIASSLVSLAVEMEWRQFAVLTEDNVYFTVITQQLNELFTNNEINIDSSILLTNNNNNNYRNFFNWTNGAVQRLIFINTYSPLAYQILCEGYKNKMLYPEYVWITYDNYHDDWWAVNTKCDPSEMKNMINGSLSIIPEDYYPLLNESYNQTISGLSPALFHSAYANISQQGYTHQPVTSLSGSAYDTLWLLALGLNEAALRTASGDDTGCTSVSGSLVPLERFSYQNKKMGCVLQESIAQVTFNGITGPFEFNEDRGRDTNSIITFQYRINYNGELVKVPVIRTSHDDITNSSNINFIQSVYRIWGRIPYDGYPTERIVVLAPALRILFSVLTFFGIIFAGGCLFINTCCRKEKVTKLSNVKINVVLLFGCTVLYSTGPLYTSSFSGFNETLQQSVLCNFRVWVFSIGYMLSFTVIMAKAWRVYYTFNNENKNVKDWMLYLIILILSIIDVFIIFVEAVNPQTRINAKILYDGQIITENSTVVKEYYFECTRNKIIVATSLSYRSFLQLMCIFFVYHTRRVEVSALNEAKQTSVIIYTNSIFMVLYGVIQFTLDHEINSVLIPVTLILQPTLFLAMIFIPLLLLIYIGDRYFAKSETEGHSNNISSNDEENTQMNKKETTAKLQARIKELENEVTEMSMTMRRVSVLNPINFDSITEEQSYVEIIYNN